jgi:hypothetical protein
MFWYIVLVEFQEVLQSVLPILCRFIKCHIKVHIYMLREVENVLNLIKILQSSLNYMKNNKITNDISIWIDLNKKLDL